MFIVKVVFNTSPCAFVTSVVVAAVDAAGSGVGSGAVAAFGLFLKY